MTSVRAIVGSALLLALWTQAHSQANTLVLIHPELAAVRTVLRVDPQGSGLALLSASGKAVLEDYQNAAVLLGDDGQWGYRHLGVNRQMFYQAGAPTDRACLELALNSSSFKWLAPNGSQLMNAQGLHDLLNVAQLRRGVISHYEQLNQDSTVTAPVKEYLLGELATALSRLPAGERSDIIKAEGKGGVLATAMARATLDLARLEDALLAAKPTTDPKAEAAFKMWLEQTGQGDAENLTPVNWTAYTSIRGKNLFAIKLEDGNELILEAPKRGNKTPYDVLTTTRGKLQLENGDVRVFVREDKEAALQQIDARNLGRNLLPRS